MLKYLIDAISYNNFKFNNYKNILELIPYDNRHIYEYDYNENNHLFKIIKEFCISSETPTRTTTSTAVPFSYMVLGNSKLETCRGARVSDVSDCT